MFINFIEIKRLDYKFWNKFFLQKLLSFIYSMTSLKNNKSAIGYERSEKLKHDIKRIR